MENEKKKIPMIISMILISLAMAAQVYLLMTYFLGMGEATMIQEVIIAIALMTAFMYVFTEYKKSSAEYFKIFIIGYLLVLVTFLIDLASEVSIAVSIIAILEMLLLVLLLVTKNFGKENSIFTSLAIMVLELATAINFCVVSAADERHFIIALVLISRLTLPVVLMNMMFLKYGDKQLRGRE